MKNIKKILFIAFLFTFFPMTVYASGVDVGKIEVAIERKINEVRVNNKLEKLEFVDDNDEVAKAAAVRAKECAEIGDVSHIRPNGKLGPTILNKKYNRAENLAVVYEVRGCTEEEIAQFVIEGWINSKEHMDVLTDSTNMNCHFNVAAVAVYKAKKKGEDVYYVCLLVRDDK